MPDQIGDIGVIHRGTAQGFDRQGKSAGFYDVERHCKTGGQTNHRAQIRRDIGLKSTKSQVLSLFPCLRPKVR